MSTQPKPIWDTGLRSQWTCTPIYSGGVLMLEIKCLTPLEELAQLFLREIPSVFIAPQSSLTPPTTE